MRRGCLVLSLFLAGCGSTAPRENAAAGPLFGPTTRMTGIFGIGNEREEFGQCDLKRGCLQLENSCWFSYSAEVSKAVRHALAEHGLRASGAGYFKMSIEGRRKQAIGGRGFGHLGQWPCEIHATALHSISYLGIFLSPAD
jgi:hypothetical protein